MPSPNPGDAADAIRRRLNAALARPGSRAARLNAFEQALESTRSCLPAIENEIAAAALPLDARSLQVALSGDNLLKALASASLALLLPPGSANGTSQDPAIDRRALVRGMECLVWRLRLAALAYAPASANNWLTLHRLYGEAVKRDLASATADGRSAESWYLQALLAAWVDPGRFPRQDIGMVFHALERHAEFAVVTPVANAGPARENAPIFVVGAEEPGAGRRLGRVRDLDPAQAAWVVDCRGIVRSLERTVARLQLDMSGPEVADLSLPVVEAILSVFRAQPTRRFARQSFKPRGDLVSGLPTLIDALAGGRATDQEVHCEWAIVDESPDGFGLRYLRGQTAGLQVGEVVGLRPRERERRLHVCLVRRVASGSASRLGLGLQELSPQARAVRVEREAADAEPAILFPTMPAWQGVPGLIAEKGRLAAGSVVGIEGQQRTIVRLLESHPRYQLWELGAT